MFIIPIDTKGFKKELRGKSIAKTHSNFKKVLNVLSEQDLYLAQFDNEETIVAMGRIVTDISFNYKQLTYAEVPLGIITRGKAVVFENGKAVRHLVAGDFVGLFETAHHLHFNSKKRLGNWTLLAEGETKIVFFGVGGFNQTRVAHKRSLENYLIELSRGDRTPKPLTDLPLLDRFVNLRNLPLKEDILIIAHTHILESSYSLFRHLAAVVGYQNIFLMDKPYSTIPKVADKVIEMGADLTRVAMKRGLAYEFSVQDSVRILWDKALNHAKKITISKIIIIDDGADILANIPWKDLENIEVVGVEQTTRGIVRLLESYGSFPPVINVAGCALKKEVESAFIADGIIQEVKALIKKTGKNKIGIVGTGNIGKKIIVGLEKSKMIVNSYDFSKFNAMGLPSRRSVTSVSEIIEKNDIIIGATGKDFLRGVVLDKAKGEKYLVSASSADVEFYSILNRAGFPSDSFETIVFEPHCGLKLNILNAGYPINFNRTKEIEKAEDMQLTRALLFAGFTEALGISKKEKKSLIFKLSTDFQREILNALIAFNPSVGELTLSTQQINKLSDGDLIQPKKKNSKYELHETTSLYLDIVRKHTQPYTIKVFGKEIVIFPEVMSPKYDWAGIFGVETLPDVKNKTVLEIGCGSGIISLFAALRGAKSVDAVDINSHAIDNTNENFKKHFVKNAKAFYSDLFSEINKQYDLVIFNLPYHGNKPQDILEYGVMDEKYKIMKKFITDLPKYMKDDGIADVGFSISGDTKLLLQQFEKNGLEIIEKYSDERFGYNCDAYILRKKINDLSNQLCS
jgi:release factor glutamine methyltransferase